jgi:hypothetical protein
MSRWQPEDLEKRFEDRYIPEPNSGCWLWLGDLNKGGYGIFHLGKERVGNRYRKVRIGAHRLSWELYHGSIPHGLWVLHKCDVTGCVNPDHLFVGTPKDNTDDMVSKGRHCHGERHWQSLLAEDDVLAIRVSNRTHAELATEYGVSFQTISDIRNRKIWRHIAGGEDYDGRRHQGRKGENNKSARLTEPRVMAIRAALACGASCASLGRKYGVTDALIGMIKRRKIWAHVS